MPTVRFSLNDEYYARLERDAQDACMQIQDYIRYKLFNETTIFTVAEALKRINKNKNFFLNTNFTLPDVYGEEWNISREEGAGALGKNFFNFVNEHLEYGIRFVGKINRRAVYTLVKESD